MTKQGYSPLTRKRQPKTTSFILAETMNDSKSFIHMSKRFAEKGLARIFVVMIWYQHINPRRCCEGIQVKHGKTSCFSAFFLSSFPISCWSSTTISPFPALLLRLSMVDAGTYFQRVFLEFVCRLARGIGWRPLRPLRPWPAGLQLWCLAGSFGKHRDHSFWLGIKTFKLSKICCCVWMGSRFLMLFAFATDLLTHILIAGISTRYLSHEPFRCLISMIDSIFNLLFCKQYLIFFVDLCHLGISSGAFRQTLSIWKPMRAIFFPLLG